jgi:hypothetical protein
MSKRTFDSGREAKEYLVGEIMAEAKREGVSLSEVERKMLYFSETDWTLPGIMDVNAEFERNYDEDEYERKIARLIRRIEKGPDLEPWDRAIVKLSEGDHYLLCLIDSDSSTGDGAVRSPHDRLRLWLTAFAIVFALFGLIAALNLLFGPRLWVVADWLFDEPKYRGQLVLLGLIAGVAVLNWRFGSKFRGALDRLLNRK